jgi:hypothetical protein
MARDEEVGRSETLEMATLQPHNSAIASVALPVPTGQEELPVVSQVDAEAREVTSTASCCCIPTGVFRPFTSTRSRSNIDHPQRNVGDATSDQPTRVGEGPSIIWFLFQKLRVCKFRHQGHDGELKPVDTNVARGWMQLAMEKTEARKGRDVEAIRWLIDNTTEDAEVEKLLSAIPGSFITDWGAEVWNKVGKHKHNEGDDRSQDEPARATGPPVDTMVLTAQAKPTVDRSSYFRRIRSVFRPITRLAKNLTRHQSATDVVQELSERVNRSLVICKNRGLFEKEELWRRHTRVCVETTASLVCCVNAELRWFGDIVDLLENIGTSENTRESSLAGKDRFFVMRWTCLSLVAIRPILENNGEARERARRAVYWCSKEDDTGNGEALAGAQKIDGNLRKASECLDRLNNALRKEEDLTNKIKEILSGCKSEISELERLNVEAENIRVVDDWIYWTQWYIANNSHRITSQIPGVLDDLDQVPVPFSRVVELSCEPHKRQFIRPGRTLKSMCSPAKTLRKILGGEGNADEYKELLESLEEFRFSSHWGRNEMQRQLLRLQDLGDGGGLGFMVELFFLAIKQLLYTSLSGESHSALYTGTFRAITSDWSKHKHSPGTQKLLLDIAWSRRKAFANSTYPTFIVDEFFSLLGNIFEGQKGPHIDEAVQEFKSSKVYSTERKFRDRMLRVFTGAQAQSS